MASPTLLSLVLGVCLVMNADAFYTGSALTPLLRTSPQGSMCARSILASSPRRLQINYQIKMSSGTVVEERAGEVRQIANADVNPTYGETGGAMLLMKDVTIARGDRDLMTGVDWRLVPGERIGVVGPNGAGKSTLLSAAAGRIPVIGSVLVKPGDLRLSVRARCDVRCPALTLRIFQACPWATWCRLP